MSFPPDLPDTFAARAAAVGLHPEDVVENFILGSGHGGQNRNKRSTAVQLVHHPSGIEIRSVQERMQHQNRIEAWMSLLEKLEQRGQAAQQTKAREDRNTRLKKSLRSKAAKSRMLKDKRVRSEIKQARRRTN